MEDLKDFLKYLWTAFAYIATFLAVSRKTRNLNVPLEVGLLEQVRSDCKDSVATQPMVAQCAIEHFFRSLSPSIRQDRYLDLYKKQKRNE